MSKTTLAVPLFLVAVLVGSGLRQAVSAEPEQAPVKSADPTSPAAGAPLETLPAGQVPGAQVPNPPPLGGPPAAGQGLYPAGRDVTDPFRPSTRMNGVVPPVSRGTLDAASPWQAIPGQSLAMPVSPFTVAPRGVAATFRPAATYGMPPGPVPAARTQKPFGTYRQGSPISPYMGLYAPPTSGVNNYNAYVRPQLEQQAFNQQVENRFRSLQPENASEAANVSPGDTTQLPNPRADLFQVGPGTPAATFMNFQPYYPSHPGGRR